jgi:hypothetical protein
MNKQIYFIILLLTCRICNSQNLVPNGDFETYSSCPSSISQLYLATPWMNPADNIGASGTPDYFTQCATHPSVTVPYNYLGFQQAHSGVSYAGIILGLPGFNVREYIEAPLTSTLLANTCYHFEMYANLGNDMNWTTDNLSIYFSDTAITGIHNISVLPFTPQIINQPGNILDTLSWTLISGDYTASGGENYLIIGNFNDTSTATYTMVNNNSWANYSYCFIDDVSLIQVPPCNTGINQFYENASVNLIPNPYINELTIEINNTELSEIILYDVSARKLLQQVFTSSVALNTEQLAKGIYLYEVRNKNGVIKKGKVVKE